MKYEIAKQNALKFANERKQSVYIAKANKKEDYKIEFTPTTTKNFSIIEIVNYNKSIKYGEWKYSPLESIAICSECGYEHYLGMYHQYATNYCPNCGQKMNPIN